MRRRYLLASAAAHLVLVGILMAAKPTITPPKVSAPATTAFVEMKEVAPSRPLSLRTLHKIDSVLRYKKIKVSGVTDSEKCVPVECPPDA